MNSSFRRLVFFSLVLLLFLGFTGILKSPSQAADITLGPWQESASYFAFRNSVSHPLPSFSAKGYFYVLLTNNERDIIYAKIKNDGSLDSWQLATTKHNEGPGRGYTAVVSGDTPYLLRFGRVEKLIIDQTTGNVTQIVQVGSAGGGQDTVGGYRYYWNSAVSANFPSKTYVFHLGGFDCCEAPHYNDNNLVFRCNDTSASQWNWQAAGQGPYQNPYKGAFYLSTSANYGYIYTSDLNQASHPLYRIKVLSNGNFEGGWIASGNLSAGDGNNLGDYFIKESGFFAVRGSKVFKAVINDSDGSLSAWSQVSSLSQAQIDKTWGGEHTEGPSFGIFGNYVYLTGQAKVYYSAISGSTTPSPTTTNCPFKAVNEVRGEDNNVLVDKPGFGWSTNFGSSGVFPTSGPVSNSWCPNPLPSQYVNKTAWVELSFPANQGWTIVDTFCENRNDFCSQISSPAGGCPSGVGGANKRIENLNLNCNLSYAYGWKVKPAALTATTTPPITGTPTPTISPCLDKQRAGDYDCSGVVNINDYEKWKTDYLEGKTTLPFFEYWRRAFYG